MGKKQLTVEAEGKQRIDIYIRDHSDLSRGQIHKIIDNAQVFLNKKPAKAASSQVKAGDLIEYIEDIPPDHKPGHNEIPVDIIYQDDDIMVINKQPGLVVHPAPGHKDMTLVNALVDTHLDHEDFTANADRLGIVHRLDKDTSGIMVVARHEKSKARLVSQFKTREIKKTYKALVHGRIEKEGKIETYINRDEHDRKKFTAKMIHGKEAQTLFAPEEVFYDCTLLNVRILTGRTHQIRVHMSYLKHPVAGDQLYGDRVRDKALAEYLGYGAQGAEELLPRQMLHAYNLQFNHPITGKPLDLTAPLPADFERVLKMLRKKKE